MSTTNDDHDDWQAHASLALAAATCQTAITFIAACMGSAAFKQDVKILFAVKAPSVVLGIFWKLALVLTVEAVLFGASDQFIPENSDAVPPDAIENNLKGYVDKFHHVFSFIFLLLVVAPLILATEGHLHSDKKCVADGASLIIACFRMIPHWSFKAWIVTLIANLDYYLGQSPLWPYHIVWAVSITTICSLLAIGLPAPAEHQPYCVAVLALMGASMNSAVAYTYDEIATSAAGDRWQEFSFQLAYTPLMTILCLLIAVLFNHFDANGQKAFVQKFMKFAKLVPGYVGAWAWQALGQSIAEERWPEPTGAWEKVVRQLALAGCIGMCALLMVCCSVALQAAGFMDKAIVQEVFTTICACNVGWAWKTFGTDLHNAMGGGLFVLWLLTTIFTIAFPLFAGSLLWVIQATATRDQSPGREDTEQLDARTFITPRRGSDDKDNVRESTSNPFCGCFRIFTSREEETSRPKAASSSDAPYVMYMPVSTELARDSPENSAGGNLK